MPISVGLWIAYVFVLLVYVLAIAYFYSYYFYAKHRIFTKVKYSFMAILLGSTILVCFLGMGIYVSIDYAITHYASQSDNLISMIFCWIIVVFSSLHIIYYCLLPKLVNKNKIDYKDFKTTNFILKAEQLQTKIGDFNFLGDLLQKKHKKYFTSLIKEKDRINQLLEQETFDYVDLLAGIITFNEQFTTRWSERYNNYQLLTCYQLLIRLQSKLN